MSGAEMLFVGVLGAIGGGAIAAIIGGLFQRPKTKAEVGKLYAEEGRTVDQRWQEWADALEERLTSQASDHANEIAALRDRLEAVEQQLRQSKTEVASLERDLTESRTEVAGLTAQLRREQTLTRSMIGWAFAMRDELRRLGGQVPEVPWDVESFLRHLRSPLYTGDVTRPRGTSDPTASGDPSGTDRSGGLDHERRPVPQDDEDSSPGHSPK